MKRFISIRDFCDTYDVGRTRLYDLLGTGKLAAVKNGHRTMIDVESAEHWAASLPRFRPTFETGGASAAKEELAPGGRK